MKKDAHKNIMINEEFESFLKDYSAKYLKGEGFDSQELHMLSSAWIEARDHTTKQERKKVLKKLQGKMKPPTVREVLNENGEVYISAVDVIHEIKKLRGE